MIWLVWVLAVVSSSVAIDINSSSIDNVFVYHFMIKHWGSVHEGDYECGRIGCHWTSSDHIKNLRQRFVETEISPHGISLSLYNIHSLWERSREHRPAICELHTNITMAETEESRIRYNHLFEPSFRNFDGYSSTHPSSNVQRIYSESWLNASDFVPLQNFSSMIKGAAYVASDCHRRDSANANRDSVVFSIRQGGFRVDGLGRCMKSPPNAEGVSLPNTYDSRYNLMLKRKVISNYLFYMAFENSLEPGYVTEKPFDGLIGGTVPVYLGDAAHLKSLIPDPKAVIFLSDFNNNYTSVAEYLIYLSHNESAYEEHRAWRKDFDYHRNIRGKALMEKSWECRICEWAVEIAPQHHKRTRNCERNHENRIHQFEGLAVRGSSRQVFLIQNSTRRAVPDLDTFFAMKLDLSKIIVLSDNELNSIPQGSSLPPIVP